MKILTVDQVIEECRKIFPEKPLAISVRDLREWTYAPESTSVNDKFGRTYTYGSRKLIPSNLKVEGKQSYFESIVPFLIRLRELQLHNLGLEAIRYILEKEQQTGKRVVLCRDCGKILDIFSEVHVEAVCIDCSETVVYNHCDESTKF